MYVYGGHKTCKFGTNGVENSNLAVLFQVTHLCAAYLCGCWHKTVCPQLTFVLLKYSCVCTCSNSSSFTLCGLTMSIWSFLSMLASKDTVGISTLVDVQLQRVLQ